MEWAFLLVLLVGISNAKHPNIMFMVIDDLGWNDLGYHDTQILTPHLNELAHDGIKLTNYYVFRYCSPSRSSFMTGRYPYHIGQQTDMNLNPTPAIACGINLNYSFVPAVLKQAGYVSYALGKWHLGFQSNAYTPTYRGFHHYLGYYSGAEQHFDHLKQGVGYTAYDLSNNTGKVVQPCRGPVGHNGTNSGLYSSYLYGNETIRILRSHDQTEPFYMYLAWNNVHDPCEAPETYINHNKHIKDMTRRKFAAMANAVDDGVRAITTELKALGMWDNTILVVTTDNGGNLGGGGNNYPLRGGKYTFWEGGVRGIGFVAGTPMIGKGQGRTYEGLMHAVDWYTTWATMVGVPVTHTGPVAADGVNMWEAITANKTSPRPHVVLNIQSTNEQSQPLTQRFGAIRQDNWKFITGYPGWHKRWEWNSWVPLPPNKPVPVPHKEECTNSPCLYDVVTDPTEHHNVADQHPEVVKQMMDLVNELAKTEVTVDASGLCPTKYGIKPDPRCNTKAKEGGFWEPWLPDPPGHIVYLDDE